MEENQKWNKRVITEQMAQTIERTSNKFVKFRNIEFTIFDTEDTFIFETTPKNYTWSFHKFDKAYGHSCVSTFIKFKLKESWIDGGIHLPKGFSIFFQDVRHIDQKFLLGPVKMKKHLTWECEILIQKI